MSKITFRADDDLVEELETFETSKSEVMRRALREYLEASDAADDAADADELRSSSPASQARQDADETALESPEDAAGPESLDDMLAARVDALVDQRVDAALDERLGAGHVGAGGHSPQDVNVNVTVEDSRGVSEDADDERKTRSSADARAADDDGQLPDPNADGARDRTCGQCGESVNGEHVYCPNCGEKATRRVFCECGDELRSDWAFCPGCGRRTAAADVLDSA